MNSYSANLKYYYLMGAYSISIGFLLITGFVGVKCLNSESWVLSNGYLAWIFGFGTFGLILLSCALIVGVRWRRSNMVVRPEMSNEQYKLLMISTGSGILLIASLLTSILTTGHSAGTFGTWMLVPFTVILWLFSAVRFAFGFRDGVTSVGLPLLVNSIIICLALLLYWINNRVEIGFRWRLSGYEDVVRLVELGELRPDENGFATLPKYYQWLSDGGEIVILQRENITSIIFYTQIEFPGEYYAFAYRSDDSIPTNFHDDRCDRGWRVQADIPNWYVCISAMVGIY